MIVVQETPEICEVGRIIREHNDTSHYPYGWTRSDIDIVNAVYGWKLADGRRVVLDGPELAMAWAIARKLIAEDE